MTDAHKADSVNLKDVARLTVLATMFAFAQALIDVAEAGNERWLLDELREMRQGIEDALNRLPLAEAMERHSDGNADG